MSHLLTCTDGSLYAPSVYEHSAWAALRMGAGIHVLHVLDAHRERAQGGDLTGAIGFDASTELTEELVRLEEMQGRVARIKGRAILEDAERQLHAAGIGEVESLQRHGSLADTLEELEPSASLVVIGKRGEHADFAKGHLGGQLQRVIRTSVRPLLVASRAFKPIQRFLVAFDGGPSSLKAVEFILVNPLLKGLECHLLHVGHPDDKANPVMEEAAARLRAGGFSVTSSVQPGVAEEVIASVVKSGGMDLLVMGACGHSPIRHLILGSTTTTMARTCLVSLLMFR